MAGRSPARCGKKRASCLPPNATQAARLLSLEWLTNEPVILPGEGAEQVQGPGTMVAGCARAHTHTHADTLAERSAHFAPRRPRRPQWRVGLAT